MSDREMNPDTRYSVLRGFSSPPRYLDEHDRRILERYGKTHIIDRVQGVKVEMNQLQENQSVCWGDGKTFYYLLTEKPTP